MSGLEVSSFVIPQSLSPPRTLPQRTIQHLVIDYEKTDVYKVYICLLLGIK